MFGVYRETWEVGKGLQDSGRSCLGVVLVVIMSSPSA